MRLSTLFAVAAMAVLFVPFVSAAEIQYSTVLSGTAEAPPNASPGVGSGLVTVDVDLATMRVESSFSGLLGNVTASHIHCCTADAGTGTAGVATPVPTFPGFPSAVTSGTYDMTLDLNLPSSFNPAYVTANGGSVSAATSALLAGLDTGRAYLNIHTSMFPGGEIRGFLQVVPEPASWALLLMGLGVAALTQRRHKRV